MTTTTRSTTPQLNTLLGSTALALSLLGIQFATIALASDDRIVRIVLPTTIALVPLALWRFRERVGVWIIFVGLAANLAVILANGGLMPIERSTVVEAIGAEQAAAYEPGEWIPGSKDVMVDADAPLVTLGDGIIIGSDDRGMAVSPGDLVIWSGLLVLAVEAAVSRYRSTRQRTAATLGGAAVERGATT